MTDHPCKGMTAVQTAAFERIAIGMSPMAGKETIKALLDKDLIIKLPDRLVSGGIYGPVRIARYDVPVPTHIQWCEWASEQPDDS